MPELENVQTQKTAGYVNSSYNLSRRQHQLEEEEKEIARLEALQKGEEFEEEESQELSEPVQQEETQEETEDDSSLTPEERSFKKRYGDLRRHMQQKEKEWQERIEALENQSKNKSIMPPKSDEDIEKWAKKYPDVASIVETIAEKKAKQLFKSAEDRFAEFDRIQSDALRVKSENKIRESHPDFDSLRASDEFHDWAESQPSWVQDALYINGDDPASVVRVIDLYKVDKGLNPAAKKRGAKDAASLVSPKSSRASIDPDDTSSYLKESQVAKMSDKEFEKHADKINQAIRTGKFVYDISGKAR